MEKFEHTKALLGDDELEYNDLALVKSSSRREISSRRVRVSHWVWVTLLLVTALLTLLLSMIKRHIPATQQVPSAIFQDDYILSDDWDFAASPRIRQYEWNLREAEFNPDGVYRPMLLINNQFPGPLIEVNEGDTIQVTVHNNLNYSTSIHWHGILQNGTNFMDGTVGITQCPVAPGASFVYQFTVSRQSGTYWYHAHQGAQASDGLTGPLIIHSRSDNSPSLNYSTDRIIMLSDHYHHLTSSLTKQYLAPDMENTEPVPDGALINGRAVRDCSKVTGRRCNNTTTSHPSFQFEQNQRQRLRIINTGAFAEFQFQIDEHELAVIEIEGTAVEPAHYHRLNISPAQRYSVIVHTNQTQRSAYRMRARMVDACFAGNSRYTENEVHGIVDYGRRTTQLPNSLDWLEQPDVECRDMNATELVPVDTLEAPSEEDAFYYFQASFRIGDYRLSRGYFNESSWKTNVSSPTLSRYIEGRHTNSTSLETDLVRDMSGNELTIQSSGIRTIDVLIHNTDDGSHPMHLHGYKYFVLASGKGYPPRTSRLEGVSRQTVQPLYDSLDLSNPLRRDTASVEADGWMLIRFVADNPGIWAFHCHIAWHSEAGLMMQFITRSDELSRVTLPIANRELCQAPLSELSKGATPTDEQYYEEATLGSDRAGTGCEGESVNACSYGDR